MRRQEEEGELIGLFWSVPPPPPPQQGWDGYKRADIISSDTHCVAESLCRGSGLEALLELI